MTNVPLHELASGFPAPQENEPVSLRQDILDELADHLACASLREQHLQSDTSQVQQAVLDRFGHPGKIARQLWQDAMWEKIMSQRVLIATCGLAILLSFGMAAIVWQMAQQSQLSQAALLSQQQEFMTTLLARMSEKKEEPASRDGWSPLEVQLWDEDGLPVTQGTVQIEKELSSSDKDQSARINMTLDVDQNGKAQLGYFEWGKYLLTVTLPEAKLVTQRNLFLRPESKQIEEFICPKHLARREIHLEFHPPEEFKALPLLYRVLIPDKVKINGQLWMSRELDSYSQVQFLFDSKGNSLGRVTGENFSSPMPTYQPRFPGRQDFENNRVTIFDLANEGTSIIDQPFSPMISISRLEPGTSSINRNPEGISQLSVPYGVSKEVQIGQKIEMDQSGLCRIDETYPIWKEICAVADEVLATPPDGQRTLTLKFVEDGPGRKPVAGIKVRAGSPGFSRPPLTIMGDSLSNSNGELKVVFADGTSPDDLVVDLPWGATSRFPLAVNRALTGSMNIQEIVVPPEPRQVETSFQIDRPAEFTSGDFLIEIDLLCKPVTIDGIEWWLPAFANSPPSHSRDSRGEGTPIPFSLLLTPDGHIKSLIRSRKAHSGSDGGENNLKSDLKLDSPSQLLEGNYEIVAVRLVRPHPEQIPAFGDLVVERVAAEARPTDSSKLKNFTANDTQWKIELPATYWEQEIKRIKLRNKVVPVQMQ